MVVSMATFEGLDQQLISLRDKLQDFYERKVVGRLTVPLKVLEQYDKSLAIIENILAALKSKSSDPSEIARQVRELIAHLIVLNDRFALFGLNIDISPLKALLERLEGRGAILKKYLTLEFIFERL
jgi:hypothetical protein